MGQNRTWIAFANEKKCSHAEAILDMGYFNCTMNRVNFQKGDIVYVFMSDTRKVRFKIVVAESGCPRTDIRFWNEEAPEDLTYELAFKDEYTGNLLDESELMKHGFKSGGSFQHPSCNNEELIKYIKSIF